MNITKQQTDALNATVTINVTKEDYSDKVQKTLSNYRKNANIPGFRKGHVPMSLVEKQYGKAVLLDEVNKILQESLNNYLVEEKLAILGNPLPVVKEDFDWDADDFSFDFELGLVPEFSVDLNAKKVTRYKIVADEKLLNEQVERIQKQYGKLYSKETSEEGDEIRGTFVNEAEGINFETTINTSIFKNKKTAKEFVGKKVGDAVRVSTKGLFADDHDLMKYLGVPHDKAHGLNIDVDFKISEINGYELAEINQELLDKLFGEGKVTSVEELKQKIKEDAERQFAVQADQMFLNDVTDHLIENTKFDLPADFLKKWLQQAGENPMSAEQAEEEYNKSEKGLRYQLIQDKIITDNNLQVTFEELKAFTSDLIKAQMAQFGQMNPSDADIENIVARVLSNQEEVRRVSDQIISKKMLDLFAEKSGAKTKEVSYDEFVKISYGE